MNEQFDKFRNGKLFHYTTFAGLDGILSSKEIWLSNLKYVNDKSEMQYFYDCLKTVLKRESSPEQMKYVDSFCDEHWARVKNQTTYAFSLSMAEDDASQWDRYANGGKGVCIIFNPDMLEKRVSREAMLQPVFYVEDVSKHQLAAIIDGYLSYKKLWNGFSDINSVFDSVWVCAGAFKHPSFRAEEEVRVYAISANTYKSRPLQYRASREGLSEYLPIQLCDKDETDYGKTIEGIIIGPNAGIDCGLMKRYLKDKGVDISNIEIKMSTCTLR